MEYKLARAERFEDKFQRDLRYEGGRLRQAKHPVP